MTGDIEVGDKVRIVRNGRFDREGISHWIRMGTIGTVISVLSSDRIDVRGEHDHPKGGTVSQTLDKSQVRKLPDYPDLIEDFPVKKKSMAKTLKALARKLLDKDAQVLVEAGVLNDDLSIRDDQFVLSFLVGVHKKALAAEARARLKKESSDDDE
jgi:hypothetical protein